MQFCPAEFSEQTEGPSMQLAPVVSLMHEVKIEGVFVLNCVCYSSRDVKFQVGLMFLLDPCAGWAARGPGRARVGPGLKI